MERRRVLQNVVAGTAVASGLATARQDGRQTEFSEADRRKLLEKYRDPERIDRAIHRHSDLLTELSEEGILEEPRVGNLDTLDTLEESDQLESETVEIYNFGTEATPRIKILRHTDAGFVSLSVFPEKETARAVFNPTENGETLGPDHLQKFGSPPDAGTQGCWADAECQRCDCYTFCCEDDSNYGCIEYCEDCSCECYCCRCDVLICPEQCT